jgi:hypothetical protein
MRAFMNLYEAVGTLHRQTQHSQLDADACSTSARQDARAGMYEARARPARNWGDTHS